MSTGAFAVRTQALRKEYRGLEVVKGLDLAVPPGGVFGFLGPNGAGKSTTMKMLLGLAHPTSGKVEMLGEEFTPKTAGRLLPKVGSLIESPSFYAHLTGRENLDIVRRIKGLPCASIDEVLKIVRLEHAAAKRAGEYSLGMKQRLGIAMALLGSPELLILDEPTNGLDPAGIHEIRELILGLPASHGLTVIVSSHQLSEIEQIAETIGIIDHGYLVYQGPLRDLEESGHLVLVVAQPDRARAMLTQIGFRVAPTEGSELVLPVCPDEQIARIVHTLARENVDVYRVEVRRRSLEEKFLQLIDRARAARVSNEVA